MKKVILIVGLILILASSFAMASDVQDIKLINPALTDGKKTVLITEDFFECSWEKNNKVTYYVVYFDGDMYDVPYGETNFRIEDIGLGNYFFMVLGFDNNDKQVAGSYFLTIVRIDENINEVSIKSPLENSFFSGKEILTDKLIKWNMILDADDYRIAFYEDERLLEEVNHYTTLSDIPDSIITKRLKKVKIVVEALKEGEVISTDSVMVNVSTNSMYGYTSELIGLNDDDVIQNNRINCIYTDNINKLYEDLYYYFQIIDKESGAVIEEVYDIGHSYNFSENEIHIKKKLENGKYELKISAFKLSDFPKDYKPLKPFRTGNVDEGVKADMEVARNRIDYYNKTISFEIKADSNSIHTPSFWAKEYIDNNIWLIPHNLDSDYRANLTREESCDLLVPFYQNETQNYYIIRESEFSDTDSINVNKASKADIIKGVGNGKFAPNNNVTREQYCVMILNMLKSIGYEIEVEYLTQFKDNEEISDWAKEAIYFLNEKDIVNGVGNNEFNPKGFVTREQSILILCKVEEYLHSLFAD